MKYLLLSITFLILSSCSKKEKKELPYDSFVYSFTALRSDYMVKFNNTDTVYFWKRFPKPKVINYALMNSDQRDSVISLIKQIDFTKYKKEYTEENVSDAIGLRFNILKNSKIKSVTIIGSTAPDELYSYAGRFNELIKNLNFIPYPGKIDFGEPIRPDLPETSI